VQPDFIKSCHDNECSLKIGIHFLPLLCLDTESYCIVQAGPEPLGASIPPTSASQVASFTTPLCPVHINPLH
jgi:hypothetical protein